MERIRAVVIGAGQAGLATSHRLTVRGVEHVVLEAGVRLGRGDPAADRRRVRVDLRPADPRLSPRPGEPVPEPELTSAWPAGAIPEPVTSIDVERDNVSTVIWTTGYRHDFSWIGVPGAISDAGAPYQREGASPVAGLFFVGLHRGWHAADGTVLGAGWLAEHVAETIAAS